MTETAPPTVAPLGNTPAAPLLPADKRVDEFADYPRDQWDRPLIAVLGPDGRPVPNPIGGQADRHGAPMLWVSEPHIRASTAGSALEHEGALNSWRTRQTVIGFMARPDLFALARAVENPGSDGRSELDKHVKAAQEAAGSGAAANQGTAAHAFAEKLDRGQTIPPLDETLTGWLEAYKTLTAGWTWHEIEARLVCSALRMAGRTDRIGSPPGFMIAPDGQIIGPDDRVVVDLKTSSSSKYFGVKFAVQLAVYGHGDLYDPATGAFTPTGARRDWALVLHIPSGATSGSWWWVNISAGFELAELANTVLAARKRRDIVAQVGQVYASLDEALAAGGVLRNAPVVDFTPAPAAEFVGSPIADASCEITPAERADGCDCPDRATSTISCPLHGPRCEIHGPHPGTVACVGCLYPDARDRDVEAARLADTDPLTLAHDLLDAQDLLQAANGTTVPDSVTAAIPPDLGKRLQAKATAERDPIAQLARELEAVATAPPRGGLEAVRERYAASWTPQHEAHAQRRGWELGILAALERSTTVDNLVAVHGLCVGWNAWTDEFERVAARRATEISKGDG